MKVCKGCGQEKPLEAFSPLKTGRDGRHPRCKACACEAARAWRLANPDEARRRDAAKHERHRERRLEKMREYSAANAERRSLLNRQRYQADTERAKAERYAYRAANPAKVRVWNGSRRAAERRATPTWADIDLMAAMYALAAIYTEATGLEHHVDHIVPLRGRGVCGLHAHTNLQVLTAEANLRKGSSYA